MVNKRIVLNFLLVLCLLMLVATAAMSGCTQPSPATPSTTTPSTTTGDTTQAKEIVFGAVEPLTGPISFVGLMYSRAFELYFDKVNEEGGIEVGGQKYTFKFISADDKYSAEGAAIAAKKLIYDDGATFLHGGIAEFETEGVYSISKDAGALLLCASNFPGSPSDVSPDRPLLVRPQYSFDDGNSVALDYLKEAYPEVKTIGMSIVAYLPEVIDQAIADFKHAAEQRGFEVVSAERWDVGTIDYLPVLTKILDSKPDAFCAYGSGQGADQYRAARQLGFTGPVFDTCPLGAEAYLYVEPNLTDFFCTGPAINDMLPAMVEVQTRWNEKYNDPFLTDATQVWDQAWILHQAILKADSVEPEKVLSAMDTMTNPGDVITTFGPARMGGIERFGVNRTLIKKIPLTLVMNGEMELIGYFDGTYR